MPAKIELKCLWNHPSEPYTIQSNPGSKLSRVNNARKMKIVRAEKIHNSGINNNTVFLVLLLFSDLLGGIRKRSLQDHRPVAISAILVLLLVYYSPTQ